MAYGRSYAMRVCHCRGQHRATSVHYREDQGIAGTGALYGRYHGRVLCLARASGADGAPKSKLREILAEFDDDCRCLPASARRALCHELATQFEQEVLRFADPDKRAVVALALKHFDAGCWVR